MIDQKTQSASTERLLGASSRMNEDRGPEPYPCPVCNAQFKAAQELEKHMETEHPGTRKI